MIKLTMFISIILFFGGSVYIYFFDINSNKIEQDYRINVEQVINGKDFSIFYDEPNTNLILINGGKSLTIDVNDELQDIGLNNIGINGQNWQFIQETESRTRLIPKMKCNYLSLNYLISENYFGGIYCKQEI